MGWKIWMKLNIEERVRSTYMQAGSPDFESGKRARPLTRKRGMQEQLKSSMVSGNNIPGRGTDQTKEF